MNQLSVHQPPQGPRHNDAALCRFLTSSCRLNIERVRLSDGAEEAFLTGPQMSQEEHTKAFLAVQRSLQPADVSEIIQALRKLTARSRARDGLASDPQKVLDWLEGMSKLMGQYPKDIALEAIADWPETHEWWPTEAEMKPSLDAARNLRDSLADKIAAADPTRRSNDRQSYPHGRTAEFARRVIASEAFGKSFSASWLSPHTSDFSDDTIFTTWVGRKTLEERCADLLHKCGVSVVHETDMDDRLSAYVEKLRDEGKLKRKA